ncbi:ADP-ribose pyrophosphatase YjhB, NUDIX family [Paenibacillus sp. 1_12]|uniref:NUDIX domain-containing protein n=1 Tax=Paenibacillus sp. 1_12 TaxID=1566278 RepID=UPI0008EFBABB|nr:NUDIX domain-containing protein [Paenibacillus sp. 1_12]SFL69367.1 ADP-ribose pyrophosphatase YjhB, NUDIX family [Paenibacillus sp. 1_12]
MVTAPLSNPQVGVGAVIRNERNEILLVLRNREPEKDTWSIPGGKLDLFESLEHSVIREIKEEVNLDVDVVGLLCMAETIRPERNEHWISAIYEVNIRGGELRNMEPDGAIGDVQWFALDRLPPKIACFTLPALEQLSK